MSKKTQHILAIDADVNVHLGKTLQMESNSISSCFENISEYLIGGRVDKEGSNKLDVIGTLPPSMQSRFVYPHKDDFFLQRFASKKDNISLLTVGTYEEEKVGFSCYHGKLGTIELVYNHLLDGKDDLIVSDFTAGVDSVGTFMFFVADMNVFIVEPTLKSISVFKEFEDISAKFNLNTMVIANKVINDKDIEFINQYILQEKLLGIVPSSEYLRDFEKGNISGFNKFVEQNEAVFKKIYLNLLKVEKDWAKYYNTLVEIYKANCREWYNDYYGKNLEDYIDPEFSYNRVMEVS
jgi:CO dehydrogenase maturation factor